jgi:hypothetical protein
MTKIKGETSATVQNFILSVNIKVFKLITNIFMLHIFLFGRLLSEQRQLEGR